MKALIRLRECACWSVTVLFPFSNVRFSHFEAHIDLEYQTTHFYRGILRFYEVVLFPYFCSKHIHVQVMGPH